MIGERFKWSKAKMTKKLENKEKRRHAHEFFVNDEGQRVKVRSKRDN